MNRRIQKIIIVLAIGISMIGLFLLNRNPSPTKQFVIGLIYVPSMTYHERLNTKLKKIIAQDDRFVIKEFTPDSVYDQLHATAVCTNAVESNADILVSTGITCSQIAAQMNEKRLTHKPIIFMAVQAPIELGLISSIENPGGDVTGLFVNPDTKKINPIELLRLIKPFTKKVLLPYAIIADGNEPLAQKIKDESVSWHIDVTLLGIDNQNETLNRINSALPGHDSLMYLSADALAMYGAGLGKLASQHHATMLAGSIEGAQNAAIAYIANPEHYADRAFELIKRILINKEHAGSIPAQTVEGLDLIINTKLCNEQDVHELNIDHIQETIKNNEAFKDIRDRVIIK